MRKRRKNYEVKNYEAKNYEVKNYWVIRIKNL